MPNFSEIEQSAAAAGL